VSYNIKLSTSETVSNSKISRIMIAIDGSEHSLKAAEYALEVAKSFNAQLFAVAVTKQTLTSISTDIYCQKHSA
jgi:nucleotide-binding universal stress UspA family protein